MAKIERRTRARSRTALRAAGAALALASALAAAAEPAAPPRPAPGTEIVDYIAALQAAGYDVAYSDALLKRGMRVQQTPSAGGPLDRLRAVLAPYGLTLRRGPRNLWLVAAAPRGPARRRRPADARRPAPPPLPPLDSIIVTASRYEIARAAPAAAQTIQQARLEDVPSLGGDALRAAATLPGLASSGLSAKFHVRGGATNESLLFLDGVRLHDPYHLKDFQSPFSSIDPRLLRSVRMWTGSYPAEFGDRLSGVVDMHTVAPAAQPHYELDASVLSTSAQSSGRVAGGRVGWLTSVRRSNLDWVADHVGAQIGDPNFADAFGELSFEASPDLAVTAGALVLNDRIDLRDQETGAARADYDDGYVWLRAHSDGERLAGTYLFAHTGLEDRRAGLVDRAGVANGALHDRRLFEDETLKGDWTLEFSDRAMLRFGTELHSVWTRYDFESRSQQPVPLDTGALPAAPPSLEAHAEVAGTQSAAYAAYRFRALGRLTAETGLRWDRQSYLGASELSPRVNVMLDVGRRGTLRAAWGRFYQSQDLAALQVGAAGPLLYPPEEADQTVLGFDFRLGTAATLRAEAYHKRYSALQPHYENLYYKLSLLPELMPDRVVVAPAAAEARGIELDLDGENGPWSWWLSLAHSSAYDLLGGRQVPRSWDEPWSLKAGTTWTAARWTATVTANVHTGWPTTALLSTAAGLVAGPLNAERLPTFASLDIKAARRVPLTRGRLEWYVELDNAFDRANPCCYEYGLGAYMPTTLRLEQTNWLPLIPTFGIRWER